MAKTKARLTGRAKRKIVRLEIVSELLLHGYTSERRVRAEVMKRLQLKTYSTQTVHSDMTELFDRMKLNTSRNSEEYLALELARIDDTVRILWAQWKKSTEDYSRVVMSREGVPIPNDGEGGDNPGGEDSIATTKVHQRRENVVAIGNVAIIAEIRQQLMERRKLLGLYAPEKREMSGDVSFSAFLVESGLLAEAERQAGLQNDR